MHNKNYIHYAVSYQAHVISPWSGFRASMRAIGEARRFVPNAKWVSSVHAFI